ncbi:MAG: hypothetical protein JWN03_7569 [Nocardia sp.]|uniref:hypothetical protein n=1 Tax=Nocardia sp. TaxID=1821 RepID=UPI00260C02C5|nr:hypothetical protein [Nocardia sp.]MCU1647294.1 hypothetical protein [Nocardia sp.]
MSVLIEFAALVLSCVGVVVAAGWGVCDDPPTATHDYGESLLIADGRAFHRVPVTNLHRLHGRHRA